MNKRSKCSWHSPCVCVCVNFVCGSTAPPRPSGGRRLVWGAERAYPELLAPESRCRLVALAVKRAAGAPRLQKSCASLHAPVRAQHLRQMRRVLAAAGLQQLLGVLAPRASLLCLILTARRTHLRPASLASEAGLIAIRRDQPAGCLAAAPMLHTASVQLAPTRAAQRAARSVLRERLPALGAELLAAWWARIVPQVNIVSLALLLLQARPSPAVPPHLAAPPPHASPCVRCWAPCSFLPVFWCDAHVLVNGMNMAFLSGWSRHRFASCRRRLPPQAAEDHGYLLRRTAGWCEEKKKIKCVGKSEDSSANTKSSNNSTYLHIDHAGCHEHTCTRTLARANLYEQTGTTRKQTLAHLQKQTRTSREDLNRRLKL